MLFCSFQFRDSLAFATEPVFSSLANVLGYHDNTPQPLQDSVKNYKLHEVEIKYGFLQVIWYKLYKETSGDHNLMNL